MALTTITDAYEQLNANLVYEGDTAAQTLALEAVRYLLFNRAKVSETADRRWDFETLEHMEEKLSKLVGAQSSRQTGKTSFTQGQPINI